MPRHEPERLAQLARVARDVHAQPFADAGVHQVGAQHQVGGGDGGAHDVVRAHHLGSAVRPEGGEDVVLDTVCQAVEEQVDAEEQHPPGHVALVLGRGVLLALLARVQREDGHAGGHGCHHEVLVQRIALAEERDVEEHDGQELARLGEQERDVVNVRQAGVAKGRGERLGEGNEDERREDLLRGEDRRDRGVSRCAEVEVDGTRQRGKERLDRIQEDWVFENLRLSR